MLFLFFPLSFIPPPSAITAPKPPLNELALALSLFYATLDKRKTGLNITYHNPSKNKPLHRTIAIWTPSPEFTGSIF